MQRQKKTSVCEHTEEVSGWELGPGRHPGLLSQTRPQRGSPWGLEATVAGLTRCGSLSFSCRQALSPERPLLQWPRGGPWPSSYPAEGGSGTRTSGLIQGDRILDTLVLPPGLAAGLWLIHAAREEQACVTWAGADRSP